jgi:hypothetical protein
MDPADGAADPLEAIVVLGCRVVYRAGVAHVGDPAPADADATRGTVSETESEAESETERHRPAPGELAGALGRRVARAARLFADEAARFGAGPGVGPLVVASGGRAWRNAHADARGPEGPLEVEADAMRRALVRLGVPKEVVVTERASRNTRDNARFSAMLLRRRGVSRVCVVTCSWHLPRALALFEAEGLAARGVGAPDVGTSWSRVLYRSLRERVATGLDAVVRTLVGTRGAAPDYKSPPAWRR